jgi:NAD(P)H-flavin reductase
MVVAAAVWEMPGVRTLDLAFREPDAPFTFAPGQFTMLCLPGIGECAISIAADPADWPPGGIHGDGAALLRHTFRAVGTVTHPLAHLVPGDEVVVRGPFGTAWPLEAVRNRHVVIAAGGLGLASVRSAILHLLRHRAAYRSVTILHGAKHPGELLFTADYEAWREAGATVLTIVDRPTEDRPATSTMSAAWAAPAAVGCGGASWSGPVGFVPALFDGLDVAPRDTSILCCGPEPMMKAVVARASGLGIAAHDIWLSMERNMACAAGFCGLCQFGPAFVCRDGPVFHHDRIAPFLAVAGL